MSSSLQHLRFALRQLRRNPGFTLAVLVTLALSIGANTAIFSIVNALMLKSLPYEHPERMGTIFMRLQGSGTSEEMHAIDGEQWELLRDNVPSLISGIYGGFSTGANLQAGGQVRYVNSGRVSAHYLDVLNLKPAIGRGFSDVEDKPNGPRVAILSYELWHNTFGANPQLIGQTIHLKGEPYTVIGILPEAAQTPLNADIFTPIQATRHGEGGGTNFGLIVRLRDGATWQQADAEVNRVWADRALRFAREYPSGTRVDFRCVPLQRGETATLRPKALTLMGAAGTILLIACANLAGLTLVRVARRTPEMATRLALGASRWQLQAQLWMENLLLAFAGGVAGIGVGYAALQGLLSLLPKGFLPVRDIQLDARVLAFTLAVSLFTSVLFGMLPALVIRKVDLRSSMATRSVAGGEGLRLRQALIACEVALTVVLLAGSGLLIRTLIHLETLPPGFNPNGLMTAQASLDDARYRDTDAFNKLLTQSVAAMKNIPGVQDAAVGLSLPFERPLNDGMQISDGKEADQQIMSGEAYVTPGYFSTLQIPLVGGRDFTLSDNSAGQRVAVVNRAFAQKFFHGANPIGRTLDHNMVIVGEVGDVQVKPGMGEESPLADEQMVYIPAAQMPGKFLAVVHVWFQPSWIVRTAGPVDGLTARMQQALASVDGALPFSGFRSMNDLLNHTLATQRIEVSLLGTMAGLALLLSTLGIFALVAHMVAQRTREIGIRMALGSSVRQAIAYVAAAGVRASLIGLAAGLALCAAALPVMRSALYGIGVYDIPTLAGVVATLAVITVIATLIPALRIAHIDPATTLREE